ncbi:MAG: hypothetical protein NC132_02590 [Corallococcus sp.]|nr:hypothetical protein [Corallococcus sp.]MCM1358996.1 hypothetical protein [Corallococcus sp.]MCM1394985.1 hypothetical protein [Corallococcus sp.]
MKPKNKNITKNVTLRVCVTAMFAALLVGGKEALAALPNVEVVTLFTAVCAYTWGLAVAVPAVFAFIAVDVTVWGFNTWVISYVVHWNVVAVVFWAFSFWRIGGVRFKAVFAALFATVLTVLFGVLTTAVDTTIGYVGGKGFFLDFSEFGRRFAALYLAGVSFFVTHVVSNMLIFAVAFVPLTALNAKTKLRMFPQTANFASQTDKKPEGVPLQCDDTEVEGEGCKCDGE